MVVTFNKEKFYGISGGWRRRVGFCRRRLEGRHNGTVGKSSKDDKPTGRFEPVTPELRRLRRPRLESTKKETMLEIVIR